MTALTASLRKTIASLDSVTKRREYGLFKAEGLKCVTDTSRGFAISELFVSGKWREDNPGVLENATVISARDIERMSSMSTPPGVIGVFRIPVFESLGPENLKGRLTLALDSIRDPGNLGTIIRVADWMGVSDIVCSADTVDCFSPKVVQATMGSLSRVKCHYLDLRKLLAASPVKVFGTFLNGENIYRSQLESNGVIVIGNESHGISPDIESVISRRLTIPTFPEGADAAESLNAAVATSIVLSEFRSRQWQKKN